MNRQGRGIGGQNRSRRSQRELLKNAFLNVQLLRRRLDNDSDIAHFYMRGRTNDAGTAFFCLFFAHDVAFDRMGIRLLDVSKAAIYHSPANITTSDGTATRP